ncbi:MAG: hypothetical protein WCP55_13060, partial [Lentisphaerota bacterium]
MDSIRLQFGQDEKMLDALLEQLESAPRLVEEIAFFTSYYHCPLPLDMLADAAGRIARFFPKIRSAGFRVGFNHLATTGHHDENLSITVDRSMQRQVGLDGQSCAGALCPADPDVRRYVRQSYELFASYHPDFIWVDDDVRFGGHMPTRGCCLCNGCIRDFSKEVGEQFTHESLVLALDDAEFKRREHIRRLFMRRNTRVISELLSLIEESTHNVDPKIELGFMSGARFWEGYGFEKWAEALRGKTDLIVRWRPGGGFYSDEQPVWALGKARDIGCQSALLPPYVKIIQAEIENFPYQNLRKAAQTNSLEMTIDLFAGCTGSALNILSGEGNPLAESIPLLNHLKKNVPFWNILKRELSGSDSVGVWPAWDPLQIAAGNAGQTDKMFEDIIKDMSDPYVLAELGIPVCYKTECGHMAALAGRMPHALGKERVTKILSGGVLLDAEALRSLEEMGLGHLTGVRFGQGYDWDTQESMTDHPLNGEFSAWKRDCRQSFRSWNVTAHELVPLSKETEILCRIGDYQGHDRGASLTTFTNELGGRVAVMSYFPWTLNKGLAKRQQILWLCDWLSYGKMPMRIESFARITPFVRRHPDGRMVIGLFNLSGDTYDSLDLA